MPQEQIMQTLGKPFSEHQGAEPYCEANSALRPVLELLQAAAQTKAPVFLQGESGTGKEGLARFVHARSPRRSGPLVAVNCGALSASLLEAELFGAVKGAYTGASSDRLGKVRQADGGTLFLDEIGDMPLEAQTRLLRVLQESRVMPVGGDREVAVDFRLICATHHDLKRKVAEGHFREDLFYRLHVVPVHVPALRERPGDIPGLLRLFLSENLEPHRVEKALSALPGSFASYAFPGNVRELRNIAQRFVVQSLLQQSDKACWQAAIGEVTEFSNLQSNQVEPSHASVKRLTIASLNASFPARKPCPTSRISDPEIRHTLESVGWHRAQAAARLGISRRALQYRLARWQREQMPQYI